MSPTCTLNLSVSLRMCTATFSFYVGALVPNSGPQDCTASTLPAEPSPHSLYLHFSNTSQSQAQWGSLGDSRDARDQATHSLLFFRTLFMINPNGSHGPR